MRRALDVRDGGCRFPGCGRRRWTDAHHIQHWGRGQDGETRISNLVLLCGRHHTLVHEDAFRVELTDGKFTFYDREGRPSPETGPRPPLPPSAMETLHAYVDAAP